MNLVVDELQVCTCCHGQALNLTCLQVSKTFRSSSDLREGRGRNMVLFCEPRKGLLCLTDKGIAQSTYSSCRRMKRLACSR